MKKEKNKLVRKILISIGSIVGLTVIGFLIYASDYYRAEESALELHNQLLEEEYIVEKEHLLVYLPEEEKRDIGIIFYPGAKVEEIAYTPLLNRLRMEGFTCIMVEMPFHMAIFNADAADDIYAQFPELETWYICGHSMGGGMASSYVANHADKIEGLILLGAYIYGEVSSSDTLTIYGTFNSNLEEDIDYTENIVIIEGGNHAQFGSYGKQKGDPDATISAKEQQTITVEAIIDFIDEQK